MNPFDWDGRDFLKFYVIVFGVAVAVALVIRLLARRPGGDPVIPLSDLQPYKIACLAGGALHAINAAILSLVQHGILNMDENDGRLWQRDGMETFVVDDFEKVIFQACNAESGTPLPVVQNAAATMAARYRKRLQASGLIVAPSAASYGRLLPPLLVLAATSVGVVKIFIGMNRHKPVAYLVLLVIISLITALYFWTKPLFLTIRGDRELDRLKKTNAALVHAFGRKMGEMEHADMLMAMGLFGLSMLDGGPGRLFSMMGPWSMFGWRRRYYANCNLGCGYNCGGSSCGGGGSNCGGGCGGCGGGN